MCLRSDMRSAGWFHISAQSLIIWELSCWIWWHYGGATPLICRFMKGAHHSLLVTRRAVPEWEFSMVLEALSQQPIESLGDISLKLLSFKTSPLLVLASAKHVSDLHALSVHPSCTKFSLSGDTVFLNPNQTFMPKRSLVFTVHLWSDCAFCLSSSSILLCRGSEAECFVSCPCPVGLHRHDQPFQKEWPALHFSGFQASTVSVLGNRGAVHIYHRWISNTR